MVKRFLILFFIISSLEVVAQCDPSFDVTNEDLCIGESLQLANGSLNGVTKYTWDFCVGELSELPVKGFESLYTSITTPIGLEVVGQQDGSRVGLLCGRGDDKLYRVTDIGGINKLDAFQIPSGLNGPEWIELVEDGNKWIGFLLNFNDGHLLRLIFEGGIHLTPDVEDLGTLGGALNKPRGIELVSSTEGHYLFISNTGSNSLVRVSLGTDWTNSINGDQVSTILTGLSTPLGLSIIRSCDSWYGLLSSSGGDLVRRLSFGTSLSGSPTSEVLSTIDNPTDLTLVEDGGLYHGFVSTSNGVLYRLDFGDDLSGSWDLETLGNLGVLGNGFGFAMSKRGSDWRGYSINYTTRRFTELIFADNCTSSVATSVLNEPSGITYSSSGTYQIGLKVTDGDGNTRSTKRSVTVGEDEAPDIRFEVSTARCVAEPNAFISSNEGGGITDYLWDFGDGSTSTIANPTHQYSTPGSYKVVLSVTNGVCENTYSESLIIYPSPNSVSFDLPSGDQCSLSPIEFFNTTDTVGFGKSGLQYLWDFNGEGSSGERNPEFYFETAGLKEISLQAFVPGCTTVVLTKQIELFEGVDPSFTYTHNCFGEGLEFTNTTPEEGVSGYLWDFGDGLTTTDKDPIHSYTEEGSYKVELIIETESGCFISEVQSIEVDFSPFVSIVYGDLEENVPIGLSGVDLTSDKDSIVSWDWEYLGDVFSTSEDATIVFDSFGNYTITLSVVTAQGCEYTLDTLLEVYESVCPYPSFDVTNEDLCIGESLQLANGSLNGVTKYTWDFCVGELSELPVKGFESLYTSITTPIGLEVVGQQDGSRVGLLCGRGDDKLYRVTDIGGINKLDAFQIPSGLNGPEWIELVEDGNKWIGFLLNFNDGHLLRLIFEGGIHLTPDVEDLGTLGGALNKPRGIELVSSTEGHYLFISNTGSNSLVRVSLGTDWTNSINGDQVSTILTGLSTPLGLSIIRSCDSWYGLLSSSGGDLVRRLSFGTSLSGSPTSEVLSTIDNPTDLTLVEDGGLYHGFVSTSNGVLYRLDFGDDLSGSWDLETLGNLGVLGNGFGFAMSKRGSDWRGYSINYTTRRFTELIFADNCTSSVATSVLNEPSGITYSSSGTYQIGLKVTDGDGNTRSTKRSVTVGEDEAPDIRFEVSTARCVAEPNAFISSNEGGGITDYLWDFGDGSTSTIANPTHQYSTPGSYKVVLSVTNGVCENTYSESLIIYPSPNSVSFDLPSGDQCSLSPIEFFNTTDTVGFGKSGLQYLWDFNGEGSSGERNPEFYFETAGLKEISLQAFVPGCTTVVLTKQTELFEGVDPSFTYTHNCFGEGLEFTNTTPEEGVSGYLWDFGDGLTTTDKDPIHSYTEEGSYKVELIIETESGCFISEVQSIEVDFSPFVSIVYGDLEENVPIGLSGVDLTSDKDSIVSWDWEYLGDVFSTSEDATIVFDSFGNYTITLSVVTAQGCEYTLDTLLEVYESVCPYPSFDVTNEDLCIGESLQLANGSLNGVTKYTWDFCVGELSELPVKGFESLYTSITTPIGLEVVGQQDGSRVGLLCGRGDDKLYRVTDIGGINKLDAFQIPSGLNGPEWIELVEDGNKWIGFLLNFNDGHLLRLIFEGGIHLTPDVEDLGTLGGALNKPRGIELVSSTEGHYLFISNTGSNSLVRVSLGTDWTNSINGDQVSTILTGLSTPLGLSIIRSCDSWYGLLSSSGGDLVRRLSFGTSLSGSPTSEVLSTIDNPTDLTLVEDGGLYHGFVSTSNGVLYRLDFGDDLSGSWDLETLGNLGVLGNGFGFAMSKRGSDWRGYSINYTTRRFTELIFADNCTSSVATSVLNEPSGITYSSSGTYQIGLKVTDGDGNTRSTKRSVTVSANSAPAISYKTLSIECATSEATFALGDDVVGFDAYQWDFGDGTTSEGTEVTHKFTEAGYYDVSVTGFSANGCSNTELKEVNIFASPLDPAFEIRADQYCSGDAITFLNQTNESNYDPDVISYQWTIGGEIYSDKSPNLSFAEPGLYEASLIVNIPGCESDPITSGFEIKESVLAEFSFSAGCEESPVDFVNTIADDELDFFWNFGDGYTSNAYEPSHLFPESGLYDVSLSVTNSNGCISETVNEIAVDAKPDVEFEYGLACTENNVSFTDVTEVNNADIVAWEWYLDTAESPFAQSSRVELTFKEPGTRNVRLVTYASNGCSAEITKAVNVVKSPEAKFSYSSDCLGEPYLLMDETENPNSIQNRFWEVNGERLETQEAAFNYHFDQPGEYEVTLILDFKNLCSNSETKTIVVGDSPEVDFEINGSGCANDELFLQDSSNPNGEVITSRRWLVDNDFYGNGKQIIVQDMIAGLHDITLSATTASGCEYTLMKSYEIKESPLAQILSSNDYGVPPFSLYFENSGALAESFEWFVNGVSVSSASDLIFEFDQTGVYEVKLLTENSSGCKDSSTVMVRSVIPSIDLVMDKIQIVESGNSQSILLEVINKSNLPLEEVSVEIKLENDFIINQTFSGRINDGRNALLSSPINLPANSNVSYVCARVYSSYSMADNEPGDNEQCINIEQEYVFEPVYPNPTSGRAEIRAVLPNSGSLKLTLLDLSGQIQQTLLFNNQPAGLTSFEVDLSESDAGIYFVVIDYEGGSHKERIIKK